MRELGFHKILLAEDKKWDNIIITALSGDTSKEDIQKAKDSGMQGHLVKPIDIHKLYKVIISSLS